MRIRLPDEEYYTRARPYIIRDPLLLHREGVRRSRGKEARRANILIVETLADILRPTLGPRGMNKLLVDKFGEMAVTNDGAVILDKMEIYHPTAKIFKEITKTIEKTVGDGTKTTVILIGELLKRARGMLEYGLHVGTIIKGYRMAYDLALKCLNRIAVAADFWDRNFLKKLAVNILATRNLGAATEHLAKLVVDAVHSVAEQRSGKIIIDESNIQVVKKIGGSLTESQLVKGLVLNKKVAHEAMPKSIRNARIAVIDMALKIDKFRHLQPFKQEIVLKDYSMVKSFLEKEEKIVSEMVEKILSVGANVVFCRKRIGKTAKSMLAKAGVLAVERLLKQEDIDMVAKATGAARVADLDDLRKEDLGIAALVEERKFGEDKMVVIEGSKNAKMVSIILRGGLEKQLDEAERAVQDVIRSLIAYAEKPLCVPGGGGTEEALAIAVRKEAMKCPTKEQVPMYAFANALESIPKLLATNSGLDPVEILTELRAKHFQGENVYGVDSTERRVVNVIETGLIEPLAVKEQVLKTCVEVASMILRIDDIIDRRYAKKHRGELG